MHVMPLSYVPCKLPSEHLAQHLTSNVTLLEHAWLAM